MRKPVFVEFANQPARLLRLAIEILDLASIGIILSTQQTTMVLIILHGWAG